MDLQLNGKRAIVTGGSQGIGRATARQLALEGCNVVIGARSEGPLQDAAASINAEASGHIDYLSFDIREPASITSFFERGAEKLGGIDILVNSAASTGRGRADGFEDFPAELLLEEYEEKFVGYLRCARAVSPYMKQQGWGRIINLAGGAGRIRGGRLSHGTRNAAIRQLTITLANALGPYGVNVLCVSPGSTVTERVIAQDKEAAAKQGKTFEDFMAERAKKTLLGHLITADEVAQVITFVCSPLGVPLNAATLDVNGGTSPDVVYEE